MKENNIVLAKRYKQVMRLVLCMLLLVCAKAVYAQDEQILDTSAADDAALYISEVCSDNDTLWALDFVDYVEVHNTDSVSLNLEDFSLQCDNKEVCALPNMVIEPDGFALLLCNDRMLDFNLPKEGCTLTLFWKDAVIDQVEIPAMEKCVWQRQQGTTLMASPGYSNDLEGARAYRSTLPQTVVINEVVSSNGSIMEYKKEFHDLIEIHNLSEETINLSDYWLSDKKSELLRWRLPDEELAPGGYYVVYASGNDTRREANFKVSADGEGLYLSTGDGKCVDAIYVPKLARDTSYGRSGEDLCHFQTPTIGAPNKAGVLSVLEMPCADKVTGLYMDPFVVDLSGEGEIYYTLNGEDPRTKGKRYEGTPIQIANSTSLRACARRDDAMTSAVRTWHYLFDAEKYELPIISISSLPGRVTGSNGIYTKWESRSRIAEVNVVLIEDGKEAFNIDCGLKLHGAGSRALSKKSFQLRFAGKYGQPTLEYPVFSDRTFTSYESLVLRCGSEDYNRAFLRDEFLTSLTAETMPEVMRQAYRPVNLYINGEYYGLYYLRERLNDAYGAAHLGGKEEDVDMISGWRSPEHGSNAEWRKLMSYCKSHNLADDEAFEYVAQQICLESFMDYYIARGYSGDRDYANIRHVRSNAGDGLWRIINFDLDWAFSQTPAGLSAMVGKVSNTSALNTVMINALLQNEGFRTQMIERLVYHLQTTYAPERALAHLDSMAAQIRHDMVYDHERWGLSIEKWEWHINFLRNFIQNDTGGRVQAMAKNAKRAFHMSDEEWEKYFLELSEVQP